MKEQLAAYDGAHFLLPDGSLDMKTNTVRISEIMKAGGFKQDGKKQVYKGMHIFPVQFFCPRQTTGEYLLTADTYCDHHFLGSWNGSGLGSAATETNAPDTYSDHDEEYEGYYSSDDFSHFEIFSTPTPEPDSAAGGGYYSP